MAGRFVAALGVCTTCTAGENTCRWLTSTWSAVYVQFTLNHGKFQGQKALGRRGANRKNSA